MSMVRISWILGGQQVDLGPDQVRDLVGFRSCQVVNVNIPLRRHFSIDLDLQFIHELGGEILEFEVHAALTGFHVATGDQGAIIPPNHTA